MRYISRRTNTRPGTESNNSFWLSFSDLMSALLLVFVLIMFYSVYQYFDMLEIKTAELLRQSEILAQKETDLESKDAELTAKNNELTAKDTELTEAQNKLTESETLLLAEQAKLLLRDQQLASLSDALDAQQAELDAATAQLAEQEQELAGAQALLAEQQQLVVSQQQRLDDQQSQLDDLVGVRKRIIASLADALTRANIAAAVDENTGAITLEASILFTSGEFDLTPQGKKVIDKFLPVYLNVLLSDEYRDNVSEIIIEGHTDSVGSYLSNLQLSQNRALAVASYILSNEYTSVGYSTKQYLSTIITANGRSESQLIYGANGREDPSASRRVEFKFRLQDEEMIRQMAELLASMDEETTSLTED